MKRFVFGFLFGALAGAGAHWYFTAPTGKPDLTTAKDELVRGATHLKDSIKKTVGDLTSETVKEELSKTGLVIREKAKAAGKAIADTATDAGFTASIKARLTKELGLPGWRIKVDTTGGLVTLTGTADTHEQVARAVKLALEKDGVVKVISTVQIKEARPPSPGSTAD